MRNTPKWTNFVCVNEHLFNFSHDLALARNTVHYTPPPNVQLMERDLAPLVQLLPAAELRYDAMAPVWGWNLSFVNALRRKGFHDLPTDEQLAAIRALSSRRTAVEMLPALRSCFPQDLTVGESVMLVSETAFAEAIGALLCTWRAGHSSTLILKALYSGSGRGLRLVRGSLTEQQEHWALRCIREQGGVVAEPYYDKVLDFALEFLVDSAGVKYLGLSVFATNENNVYVGNIIAPQSTLQKKVIKFIPTLNFQNLIDVVASEINCRFTGHYLGPVGVDMMIVRVAETDVKADSKKSQPVYKISPCVEVNVRRTMGELSLHLLPLLADGTEGFFRLLFDKSPAALARRVVAMPSPVYDAHHRLIIGTHLLTPITPDHATTHYVALLETI